jgi:hypothetical protein
VGGNQRRARGAEEIEHDVAAAETSKYYSAIATTRHICQ